MRWGRKPDRRSPRRRSMARDTFVAWVAQGRAGQCRVFACGRLCERTSVVFSKDGRSIKSDFLLEPPAGVAGRARPDSVAAGELIRIEWERRCRISAYSRIHEPKNRYRCQPINRPRIDRHVSGSRGASSRELPRAGRECLLPVRTTSAARMPRWRRGARAACRNGAHAANDENPRSKACRQAHACGQRPIASHCIAREWCVRRWLVSST